MSEPHDEAGTGSARAMGDRPDSDARQPDTSSGTRRDTGMGRRLRLSRRAWTLVWSIVLVLVFGVLGTFARVPYVGLGPGPTYNTLGEAGGAPVIHIDGKETYPTAGELRMTTVSLSDDVSLFGALGLWVSGRYALAPREQYYKPGESDEQVKRENTKQFKDSQSDAEVAALRHLGYPVKVLAQQVEEGSPADENIPPGARLHVVNGQEITKEEDVQAAMKGTRPGQSISVTFQPDGEPEQTTTLTLRDRGDRQEGFMGLTAIDRADVPFDINISLEDVGGPSAGLIFALAIADRLTPGELVAGEHIAGTGQITEKGQVQPIGGISFKVVAAKEAGASAFLVPERNCAEAASAAPEGLRLLKVSDFNSAFDALQKVRAGQPAPTC